MTTETQPARRPLTAGRILVRIAASVTFIIVGLFFVYFCSDMFAGYGQYGTQYITWVGIALLMAAGGVIWIIDHRRLDAGDSPDADGRPDGHR